MNSAWGAGAYRCNPAIGCLMDKEMSMGDRATNLIFGMWFNNVVSDSFSLDGTCCESHYGVNQSSF